MPRITENDKTYWIPEVLPKPTAEHQNAQSEKLYLTHEGKERRHPGWTYAETNAYVDDEYLFQNEGWKVIIDDGKTVDPDDLKNVSRKSPEDWEKIDEKTLKVTYALVDYTQEEKDKYSIEKWDTVRKWRDDLLKKTDWIIVRATEESLTVSSEVISYRKKLRDLPSTISNILSFKGSELPIKPTVYFEAG
jgi:hypothetical protein